SYWTALRLSAISVHWLHLSLAGAGRERKGTEKLSNTLSGASPAISSTIMGQATSIRLSFAMGSLDKTSSATSPATQTRPSSSPATTTIWANATDSYF